MGAMRADMMTWTQRLVGAVFVIGLAVLTGAIATLLRQAEGIPPLPVYTALLGLVALILLSGACLALISIAISARRGADALRRMAANGSGSAPSVGHVRPFSAQPLQRVAQSAPPQPATPAVPAKPTRPSGRSLVAER